MDSSTELTVGSQSTPYMYSVLGEVHCQKYLDHAMKSCHDQMKIKFKTK